MTPRIYKACSLEPILTWLVKQLIQFLAQFLTILFNRSLSQGYLPEAFRLAEVRPILKKSSLDPAVLGNYRPISNFPFVSKVLERAVNERMLVHLQTNGLMPKNQSAFDRDCPPEGEVGRLTRCWSGQANTSGHARSQRGFRLCGPQYTLESAWEIVRFLRDGNRMDLVLPHWKETVERCQPLYPCFSGCLKVPCSVHCFSFNIPLMLSALPRSLSLDFSIHGHVDDYQIYDHCLVRDTVQLNGRPIYCIDCMGQWMLKNRLKLNASKTEFIWLGSPRRLAACSFDSIVVDRSTIQPSLTVRDLSVIIDPAIILVEKKVEYLRGIK